MGAWGMGVFDDDTSCEIMEDAIDSGTSVEELINRAVSYENADYLEYEECHQIIVAGAISDTMLNNKSYCDLEGIDAWVASQSKDLITPYKAKLISLLEKVTGEDSELNELWSENEDDYPTWKANISGIIQGLSS